MQKVATFLNRYFIQFDMAITHTRSTRKASGGRYKKGANKKKQYELGRQPALTHIGERRAKSVRTLGNNKKVRVTASNSANVFDPKTKKYVQAAIKSVLENPANRHFVRRNIMTKGAVIETDKGKAKITSRPGQDGSIDATLVE